MQSRAGWSEKGRTQPPSDKPDGAPTGAVGAARSGSRTGGGGCQWRWQDHHNPFRRSGVRSVPHIDPRCNGGTTRSEHLHRAKAFGRVAVGHFKMMRPTGGHRLRIPVVALNHRVILSQRRQDLADPIPVGLTDASGSSHSLRKLLMGPLQLLILSPQVLYLSHQGLDARFTVHHTPGIVTGVHQVSLPPCLSGALRMLKRGTSTPMRRR